MHDRAPLPWAAESFEQRYRARRDPWQFDTCPRERARFDTLLRALERPRYGRALEVGCAEGALTWRLAPRCRHLDAIDVAPTALARARARCADLDSVCIHQMGVEDISDAARYELVVVSEVGYYFDEATLATVMTRLLSALEPGGELILSHWTGTSADHQLHADDVHRVAATCIGRRPTLSLREETFRLDRWTHKVAKETP